jgi:hypothetical protein
MKYQIQENDSADAFFKCLAREEWECEKQRCPTSLSSVSADMNMMHCYYGVPSALEKCTNEMLVEFLKFRFNFLNEELQEGICAIHEKNPEEIVDSLIDLVVVAVGTLDLFKVNFDKAWFEVLKANMNKKPGIKPGRPNPFGLPDLIKAPDWIPPSHENNHGLIGKIFE